LRFLKTSIILQNTLRNLLILFGGNAMNRALKHALIDYPFPAYQVAWQLKVHHSTLSKFISEVQQPTEEQKGSLSRILGKPKEELFPVAQEPA